uniref:Uncharacterized protein n=1 Tax=Triticum urartu TaxID=4572 RepID=A0A8R7UMT2_TRIUA
MRGAAAEAGAVLVHCWRSGRRRCRRRRPWQKVGASSPSHCSYLYMYYSRILQVKYSCVRTEKFSMQHLLQNFILSFIGVSFITKRTDSGRQPPPKAPGPGSALVASDAARPRG